MGAVQVLPPRVRGAFTGGRDFHPPPYYSTPPMSPYILKSFNLPLAASNIKDKKCHPSPPPLALGGSVLVTVSVHALGQLAVVTTSVSLIISLKIFDCCHKNFLLT